MPSPLSKQEKAKCKVIVTILIVTMLLKRVDEKINSDEGKQNPAVSNCVQYIDSLLEPIDEDRRALMNTKIDTARIRLTKRTRNIGVVEGLVGSLRYLIGGTIKSKPGTHLDYIKTVFRRNLSNIEKRFPVNEKAAAEFEKKLREIVKSI